MALVKCKECGHEISTKASACPQCGAKLPKPKLWLWIPLGAVVAFLGFGAMVGNSPEAKAKARERQVIELCWDDQKRKSLAPAEQRFVASTCEMLENDFRRKHGHNP